MAAKKLTTKQAFEQIIYDREYRLTLSIQEQRSIGSYKSLYEKGRLSLGKIGAFLEKHGYKVAQEALWIK